MQCFYPSFVWRSEIKLSTNSKQLNYRIVLKCHFDSRREKFFYQYLREFGFVVLPMRTFVSKLQTNCRMILFVITLFYILHKHVRVMVLNRDGVRTQAAYYLYVCIFGSYGSKYYAMMTICSLIHKKN